MTQLEHKEATKKAIAEFNFDTEHGFKLDKYGSANEELKASEIYAISEMSKDKIEVIANAYKFGYMQATVKNKA